MRSFRSRSGLLLVAAIACLPLVGCSGGLFRETVGWSGGTFYNEKKHIMKPSIDDGMTLRLDTGGTGHAYGIPRGHQKMAKNICIEVSSKNPYSGDLTWKKVSNERFEITFPGSRYTV